MSPVLEMKGVTRLYPGTPPVPALRGIDLRIAEGELVSVVGPSGSGKSTLLHIMGTLDRPSAGTIRVSGFDVGRMSDRQLSALRAQRIGFVFQQFHLLDAETALDNVADGLLYTGRPAVERRRLARETLEKVGLAHRVHQHASKLSGGERQRVAVARAIVGRPALVLADEPTGNLDSHSSDAIVALLEELNAEGITMVVITHNPEIAARFPRRVALRDGLVEADEANAKGAP
ncbi:MAG: ABC transporter ATP-binding protein [Acidimicrobiia bacterium]|nr:ABC transporter ATP-binding protein [Acidimicrobiia bacterium]